LQLRLRKRYLICQRKKRRKKKEKNNRIFVSPKIVPYHKSLEEKKEKKKSSSYLHPGNGWRGYLSKKKKAIVPNKQSPTKYPSTQGEHLSSSL